jgi:hypothetical protein
MKQTAVEFLLEKQNSQMGMLLKSDFIKAKEMEIQQQGYSEEEVLEIIKKLYVEIGFQFINEIKEWVNKQFKNK